MRRLSLTRAASPLVIGRLTSAALTFALPLVLARTLDARGFGAYKQLFLVAQTLLLVGQLGLTQSLYFFLPGGRADRGVFVGQTIALLGVIAACAGAALTVGGEWLGAHLGDGALARLATPLAFLGSGMLLGAPLEAGLTSEGRVGLAGLAYVLSDGSRAALLLVGARGGGLHGLAWAAAAWAWLRVVALAGLLVGGVIPIARPRAGALRVQLAYALPFAGSVLLFVGQRQFTQYAIATRFDAATFAVFAVASFHLPVVDILYSPIADVLMLELGRVRPTRAALRLAVWDDAVEKLATVLWPATACAWLFGGAILPVLFSHRYAASVPLFLVASFEIPLWVLPVDALLRAAGATRFLFAWYGVRLVITVAAVLGGLRLGGLPGALVGSIASEVASRVVMMARGARFLGVAPRRAIDPALFRVALDAAGAALAALAMRSLVQGRAGLFAGIAVYGVSYLGLRLGGRAPRRAREATTGPIAQLADAPLARPPR